MHDRGRTSEGGARADTDDSAAIPRRDRTRGESRTASGSTVAMPLRRCQLCAAVVVLLSCPAALPAPVARVAGSSLQWFGWWAWGSKHLPGQTVPTAAHANIAIDENLDYLLNQPLPALLALHPPRRSDNASIFVIAPSSANPANRVGHMLLAPDWLQKLDTVVKQVHAHQPKICLLYTSPSPRDQRGSRMPSSA